MWPSEELASRLYNMANVGLIVGLVLGVICTALVVWMGNVKEAYLQKEIADTDQRAALANERAAEAQKTGSEAGQRAAHAWCASTTKFALDRCSTRTVPSHSRQCASNSKGGSNRTHNPSPTSIEVRSSRATPAFARATQENL